MGRVKPASVEKKWAREDARPPGVRKRRAKGSFLRIYPANGGLGLMSTPTTGGNYGSAVQCAKFFRGVPPDKVLLKTDPLGYAGLSDALTSAIPSDDD